MPAGHYILVDQESLDKILKEIADLKALFLKSLNINATVYDDLLMDTAAVVQYLKLDRRTIYTYRQKGMPCVQKDNGRLFFWKSAIDTFFGKNK